MTSLRQAVTVAFIAVLLLTLCAPEATAAGSCGAEGPRRTANTNCAAASDCSFRGLCEPRLSNGTCLCFDGFATLDGEAPCGHTQRSQATAFMLTIFFGWSGADYFYIGHTDMAAGKIVYYIGGAVLILIIRAARKSDEDVADNKCLGLVQIAWKIGALVWYIYDIIGFATCHEVDGHGVPLQAW